MFGTVNGDQNIFYCRLITGHHDPLRYQTPKIDDLNGGKIWAARKAVYPPFNEGLLKSYETIRTFVGIYPFAITIPFLRILVRLLSAASFS